MKEDNIINGKREGNSVSLHILMPCAVAEKTISENKNKIIAKYNEIKEKNNLFIKSPV